MKKLIGIVALSVFVGAGAFAQTPNFSQVQSDFQTFSSDVASSLPYASTIGLNWSWAYIGNFPHFGAGLAAGVVTLPTKGFNQVMTTLAPSFSLPSPLNNPNLGLPLPAYVAEARIGGFILPFDIGIKAGFIPKQLNFSALLPTGTHLDFHLYGVQLRYRLAKEKFLMPSISIGAAVNYFDGNVGMSTGTTPISIGTVQGQTGTTYNLSMTAPTVNFNWKSTSFDASIEASKHVLLLFTPYLGAGVSYGISSAGGGVTSQMQINGVTASSNPSQFDSYVKDINAYYSQYTSQTVSFNNQGFSVSSSANGWSARAFGGLSVNLAFLKIDGTVMYSFMTHKLGATVGTRLQF